LIQAEYPLERDKKRFYLSIGSYSWNEVINLVLDCFPKHMDLQINQILLPSIPNYFEQRLGMPDGQSMNLGCRVNDGRSIHLKVYDKKFYRLHWDAKDPKQEPLGHLVDDAPEVLLGIIGIILTAAVAYLHYKKNKS